MLPPRRSKSKATATRRQRPSARNTDGRCPK
jgi:hypothetical protein